MAAKAIAEEEYRETELGLLPKDWTVVKLEQVTENLDNKRIPLNEEERRKKQGLYPYCGANGIIDYVNNYIYDGEFVLLAEDGGYWGAGEKSSYIMNGKFWVNNHAHVIKAIESKTTNNFLCYALNHIDMSPLIGGDARGKLTQAIMRSIPLPLPPLPEQQNIAFVLSTVQDAQQSTERAINSLRELKKSLMKHLFTYGAVSFEDADKVKLKETEIGELPKSWEAVKLGNISEVRSGGTPSRANKTYWDKGDIPWIKSGQCQDCNVNFAEEYITQQGLDNSSAKILQPDTVLVAMVGATIGKTGYLTFNACTNQNVAGIYSKNNVRLHQKYLFYVLQSKYPEFTKTQGFVIANLSFIKNLQIPVPSIEEQQQIASILKTVDEKIDAEQQRKKALTELFNSLLKNLMTAKIRVKDLEVQNG